MNKQTNEQPPHKEVISIQPGDVIVVTSPFDLGRVGIDLIAYDLKKHFPDNESIVLTGGTTMEVYREQGRYVDVSNLDGVKRTLDTQTGKRFPAYEDDKGDGNIKHRQSSNKDRPDGV